MTGRSPARIFVELVVSACGIALLWIAWKADLHWFEWHLYLCYMGIPKGAVTFAHSARFIALGFAAFFFLVVRPLWLRAAADQSLGVAIGAASRIGVALLLAALACEGALRMREHRKAHPLPTTTPVTTPTDLRTRTCDPDPRYGWIYHPSQEVVGPFGGRQISFAIDAHSNRAATTTSEPDYQRPTILFAGESVTAGQGLLYAETFPSIVAERLGMQAVNLGVLGYGSDQAYLRLVDALPAFAHPTALVTLFMPAMMNRSLAQWRSHLALDDHDQMIVVPAIGLQPSSSRLIHFLEDEAPGWSNGFMDRTLALNRAVFRDTANRARARGAVPLFVVPRYGGGIRLDRAFEEEVLHTVFGDLPYVVVDIDPEWNIAGDGHPDARAAEKIATAVVAALRAAHIGTQSPQAP